MKKTLLTIVLTVLICCTVMGTTLALLVAQSETVTNTFTVGNINITLTESDDLDLKMVPGKTIEKDPTVTVEVNSEACWLFVKIEETNNPMIASEKLLTYSLATGWTALGNEYPGVYYREVAATTATAAEFQIIANDEVLVSSKLTKEMIDATGYTAPTISFAAAAVQAENVDDVEDAWDAVKDLLA